MAQVFLDAVKNRRTYYGISKESPVSDQRLQEIIAHAVRHAPSAFNSQSSRVILLLGPHQDKLWEITREALRKIVPAGQFAATDEKITAFGSGYGTALFFEDQPTVKDLQEKFPLYAANFPIWSEHASGMLQYIIWTALEDEGFGASLQHYAPVIEAEVKREWNIPAEWKLIAQMPFGKPTAPSGEKDFLPLESRFKTYR